MTEANDFRERYSDAIAYAEHERQRRELEFALFESVLDERLRKSKEEQDQFHAADARIGSMAIDAVKLIESANHIYNSKPDSYFVKLTRTAPKSHSRILNFINAFNVDKVYEIPAGGGWRLNIPNAPQRSVWTGKKLDDVFDNDNRRPFEVDTYASVAVQYFITSSGLKRHEPHDGKTEPKFIPEPPKYDVGQLRNGIDTISVAHNIEQSILSLLRYRSLI